MAELQSLRKLHHECLRLRSAPLSLIKLLDNNLPRIIGDTAAWKMAMQIGRRRYDQFCADRNGTTPDLLQGGKLP